MSRPTILIEGERFAAIGEADGSIKAITIEAARLARSGIFERATTSFHSEVAIPRSITYLSAEGRPEAMVDVLKLGNVRLACLGEVLEFRCGFDGTEEQWYVQESSKRSSLVNAPAT